jgi:hypothetical protein
MELSTINFKNSQTFKKHYKNANYCFAIFAGFLKFLEIPFLLPCTRSRQERYAHVTDSQDAAPVFLSGVLFGKGSQGPAHLGPAHPASSTRLRTPAAPAPVELLSRLFSFLFSFFSSFLPSFLCKRRDTALIHETNSSNRSPAHLHCERPKGGRAIELVECLEDSLGKMSLKCGQ